MVVHERPLSPHATIYRWPLNAIMSILHRVTGIGLTVGAVLAVWWLLAASISAEYFHTVDGILTSFLGDLVLTGSLAALWYHCCNGIRHLVWDSGHGFEDSNVRISGWAGLAAAFILTAGTLVVL
ncbi:MAG: succinate dehydrogenase, cytochrome b556 subunit [Rhodobacteraceae bacterium]|nr:succinate dehydrogenase, cytochrome b556 subunit [Paracoccaceae bacterium]